MIPNQGEVTPMFGRLGVSCWSLEAFTLKEGKTLEEIVPMIAEMGVDGLDIMEYYLGFDPQPNIHDLRRKREFITSHGLDILGCWFYTDLLAATHLYSLEKVIGDIETDLAAAALLESTYIVIHSGDPLPGMSLEDGREILLR